MIINKLELFFRASRIALLLYEMDLETAQDWDLYASSIFLRNGYYRMISEFGLEEQFLDYCKSRLPEVLCDEIKNTAF